ncbi:MAG TPA: YHS domain-containing protein [Blastocatellia bacterium]|nr:YHS domain-containing protein [Blastocatellia bacterium]
MASHTDPVCGMQVDEENAAGESEYLEQRYYFCSEDCKHKFDQRPEDYVVRSGQAGRSVTSG